MEADRHIWRIWAAALHRWGLQELAASLIEAFGPLTLVVAQAIYLGQPLLNHAVPRGHLEALANMLEDSRETKAFATYLREGNPS